MHQNLYKKRFPYHSKVLTTKEFAVQKLLSLPRNMRFVLTAQAFLVILKLGRPAAQTLGRYGHSKQLSWRLLFT